MRVIFLDVEHDTNIDSVGNEALAASDLGFATSTATASFGWASPRFVRGPSVDLHGRHRGRGPCTRCQRPRNSGVETAEVLE